MVDGIPELQEKIAEKSIKDYGVSMEGTRKVVVTAGGNMAFLNAVLAITDPGDEIIQIVPYYFNHEMAVTMANCISVCVESDEHFYPDVQAIQKAITEKTRAIVTISPNNPTGAVYSEETLREINALCAERGVYHIHDEAYEYFTYGGIGHFSPSTIDANTEFTISLFSMSKAYGFASWRIGWMIIPASLVANVKKIQDTNVICPPVVSQWAAVGALSEGRDFCRLRIAGLEAVRSTVLERLKDISNIVTVVPAGGALYLLLAVGTDIADMALVERLIREYRVAAIPGSTFGIEHGTYLRISFGALDEQSVTEGTNRLVRGLKEIVDSK